MPVARWSVSISFELDQAMDSLVAAYGQPKSALIEMLLRENPVVKKTIDSIRQELEVSPIAVPGTRSRPRPTKVRAVQRTSP